MQQPYLIQAAQFYNNSQHKGIDSILEFDYMGSAEFEFGALPKSLGRIRKGLGEYIYHETEMKGKGITIFCKKEDLTEVLEALNKLAEYKIHLKEWIEFGDWLTGKKVRNDLWWDIQNHFMWWKSNSAFKVEFELLIKGQN